MGICYLYRGVYFALECLRHPSAKFNAFSYTKNLLKSACGCVDAGVMK